MNKNKKYIAVIIILSFIIIFEPFISLKIGNKFILTKSQYQEMKYIHDKYSRQERIIKKLQSTFLYKIDNKKLMEGSLRGAIEGFDDPYTVYMDPQEASEFMSMINNSFNGIGIIVKIDIITNSLIIDNVLPNSPAAESGLKNGDKIIKINNEEINLKNTNLESIISKIKGPENSNIQITITRNNEIIDFNITRKKIELISLYSKQIDDTGYIKLLNFDNNSSKLFESTLNDFNKNDVKKLIIDLRNNPGGSLDEVKNICNLFTNSNTVIAYTKDNKGYKTEIKTSKNNAVTKIPTVIIVNENSASASELFSGMMKDYKLATIIGSTTFGKGLVQKTIPLKDGSIIKITFAEYFTPKNNKINKIGVIPDIDLSSEMQKQKFSTSLSSEPGDNTSFLDNFSYPADSSSFPIDNLFEDICFQKALEILNKQ